MLNTLRENLKQRSWPKWLLLLVAASMTLYLAAFFSGGQDGNDSEAGNWAVKIDGESIPARTYLQLARRIDQTYRQLLGTNYGQMRQQFQIGTQAMRELLEREMILRDARRLGLSVSDEELIQRIRSAPELADPAGNFIGKQEYQNRVNRFYPGGVAAFEREMADEILIEKWTELISQSVSVDEADLETVYRERHEKTAIRYAVLPAAEQNVPSAVLDEEAQRWYSEHQELYRRAEGRRIRYVTIERQPLSAAVQLTDEDIRAAYEAGQSRFTHPEQRRARHILFKFDAQADPAAKQRAREQAEQTLARVRAGEDFGALASSLSQDTFSAERGGDLDWFERGKMVGPFDEAVFGTRPGELAPVTETQFGFHVIQVTDERPAGTLPLEDVRDQLVGELRVQRAEEAMMAQARRLRDRIDSPESFEAAAAEAKLAVERRFVNEDEGLREIGASNEFRIDVLALEPGQISEPLRVSRGVAIVVVDELVPAAVAPLEEVRERVSSDLLNDRARRAAVAAATEALERHGDVDRAAKALAREAQDSGDLAPGQSLPGSGGSSPEMRRALFGAASAPGSRGVVEVPAGALIFEVTKREPFDAQAFAAGRDALRTELLEERRVGMRRSMVDQLSRQSDIVINQQLVQSLDEGA